MTLEEQLARWVDTSGIPKPERPRRIAVVGRISCGKSTLIRALSGVERPVGLGGITREVEEVPDGSHVWLDTPGIDGLNQAIDILGPAIDHAHGLIWVVDGLQPLTRTEHRVVELLMQPGMPLDVVIARADLIDPSEREQVLRRVETRVAPFAPATVSLRDLRRPGSLEMLRHHRPTPAEKHALYIALSTMTEPLRAARPVDRERLRSAIAVRPAVRRWLANLEGTPGDPDTITSAFFHRFPLLLETIHAPWSADRALPRPPPLPPPPRPEELEALRHPMTSRDATWRALRSLAASWAASAELVLLEWCEGQPVDHDALRAHRAASEALERALRKLSPTLVARSPSTIYPSDDP